MRALVPLLYRARALALAAADPALRRYRRRYRHVPTVHGRYLPEGDPRPMEGYPDRLWYRAGEEAAFHLRSPHDDNVLVVERVVGPGRYEEVTRVPFGRAEQPAVTPEACERGCGWAETLRLPLDPARFRTGYYRGLVQAPAASPSEVEGSAITFLVQRGAPGETGNAVAVLAPVGTWVAYNPHGGKSLYHNAHDGRSVYFASAQRPNPALSYDPARYIHSMWTEASAFAWLDDAFGADLYPDWALETPALLDGHRLLVLLYHAEYVSAEAHAALRALVGGGRSLLSLGANQLYWKVRWHDGHTRMECRKDATPFSDGSGPGGLWRHTGRPEDELLGVRFTAPGTGTYAPYEVTAPAHWLFEGTGVRRGDLFGQKGVTPYPICGDETDEPTPLGRLRAEVVARGRNRPDGPEDGYATFDPADPAWDGSAGGALALTPRSARHAVLATGSIHSASGLGVDPVFSRLVANFVRRYAG